MDILKIRKFRQETLYMWFLFLMLLPCIALAITEPISPWIKTASVLLPMCFYMLTLNLFKKPGYIYVILFIIQLINGYQLVLLYLFNESVISPDMFLTIVTSDSSESGELMRTIWPAVLIACLLYITGLGLAIYSIASSNKLHNIFIKKMSLYSIIPLVLGIGALGINKSRGYNFIFYHDIYPVNAVYNLGFAVDKYFKINNHPETSSDFTFNAEKESTSGKREIYMLMIGETSRAANWQLYGYDRETNPELSKRDDVLIFKDVLTEANITHKAVPMILSLSCAEDFDCIYNQKSIITAFKEAGFKTGYFSNQIPDKAFIDNFSLEADTVVRLYSNIKESHHPYDNDIIDIIGHYIDSSDEPMFLVFHSYGSHFEYSQRYPENEAFFKPFKAESVKIKNRPILVNAYDNTIHYTDKTINGIIKQLDRPDVCSSLLYLSDHGEDLMDDERNMFLHCSPVPTYYQLHVPFLIWFSNDYKAVYSDKYDLAVQHTDSAASSRSVFHTLIDIADIKTPLLNEEYSLVNNSMKNKERFFIDIHDNPISFYSIGLKDKDWYQIKKQKIGL